MMQQIASRLFVMLVFLMLALMMVYLHMVTNISASGMIIPPQPIRRMKRADNADSSFPTTGTTNSFSQETTTKDMRWDVPKVQHPKILRVRKHKMHMRNRGTRSWPKFVATSTTTPSAHTTTTWTRRSSPFLASTSAEPQGSWRRVGKGVWQKEQQQQPNLAQVRQQWHQPRQWHQPKKRTFYHVNHHNVQRHRGFKTRSWPQYKSTTNAWANTDFATKTTSSPFSTWRPETTTISWNNNGKTSSWGIDTTASNWEATNTPIIDDRQSTHISNILAANTVYPMRSTNGLRTTTSRFTRSTYGYKTSTPDPNKVAAQGFETTTWRARTEGQLRSTTEKSKLLDTTNGTPFAQNSQSNAATTKKSNSWW